MNRISLYNVMTKEVLINLRINEQAREDFKIVAELRGASMSTLLHQFIYKSIREEKERIPEAFKPKTQIKAAVQQPKEAKVKTG